MDKATVKLLLESYRPQDAHDPIFAEALQAVASDPELAAWFEEMQRIDAMVSSKLQATPVPPDLKERILLGYRATGKVSTLWPPRGLALIGSIAAMLILGLLTWHFLPSRQHAMSPLAQRAVSYTHSMPPLQFVCFDAAAVADWINKQPGSKEAGVKLPAPPESLSMVMIGSSVVDWNGRPVVVICLQNSQRMAWMYILKARDSEELKGAPTETAVNEGWVVQTTKLNGQVRLLTTKGRPEDLNFPTPF